MGQVRHSQCTPVCAEWLACQHTGNSCCGSWCGCPAHASMKYALRCAAAEGLACHQLHVAAALSQVLHNAVHCKRPSARQHSLLRSRRRPRCSGQRETHMQQAMSAHHVHHHHNHCPLAPLPGANCCAAACMYVAVSGCAGKPYLVCAAAADRAPTQRAASRRLQHMCVCRQPAVASCALL
jgi:hypothetical protein